ncbi:23S rRNA pseudouridine2605 synthase [Paracoccus isoporae]|uniref:Pseudouridine synthase n=1 Tax=Paracoccus isoporae TaxID=591205 RepID=A0A1G7E2W8_9RHOB|nr:pseudouridine synthase [Paracoccus isoporae]SDE58063.1 23S rRNA pseudouridine2605 synthase [Paracoccus isoporae]
MTDQPNPDKPANADRIAKVIARAGLASRREAERMILEGRVTVNGQKIDSPALDVLPADRITVDGKRLEEPQETRLWLYYKPVGLITSEADEKGRQTVFDALPRDLPRVMSVGRLDLNSEGLLLLTNDGELKRRLELPETGWLRRYRVRVNGQPNDLTFAPLRRGVEIEGEEFAPMEIKLDSQQGANAWLTVGIREGKNREIRRAMAHVGLQVNRLIRIGYGPFKLTGLEANEVREIKRRVLRDQLGGLLTGEAEEKDRPFRAHGADPESRDRRDAGGDRRGFGRGDGSGRKDDRPRPDGARGGFGRRGDGGADDGSRRPGAKRGGGDGKPFGRRDDAGRTPAGRRAEGEGATSGRTERGQGAARPRRDDGERKPYERREGEARRPRQSGAGDADGRSERKPFNRRDDAARKPRHARGDDAPHARSGGEKGRAGKPAKRFDREGAGAGGTAGARRADTPRGGFSGKGPRGGFKPDGAGPKRGGRPGGGPAKGPSRSGPKGPRRPSG